MEICSSLGGQRNALRRVKSKNRQDFSLQLRCRWLFFTQYAWLRYTNLNISIHRMNSNLMFACLSLAVKLSEPIKHVLSRLYNNLLHCRWQSPQHLWKAFGKPVWIGRLYRQSFEGKKKSRELQLQIQWLDTPIHYQPTYYWAQEVNL